MSRKRKVETGISTTAAKENSTSNQCPKTTGKENIHSGHTHHDSNATKAIYVEALACPDSNDLPGKSRTKKFKSVIVRQSARLKSSVFIGSCQKVEHVVKHVKHVETEKAQQVNKLPTPSEINMKQEAPQIQQLHYVQAVNNLAEMQNTRRPNDSASTDLSYKSLYVDSMKKVQELMEDNIELARRLDSYLEIIKVYEKKLICSGAPKEVVSVSSLSKATAEATIKPSPPTEDAVPGADNDHTKYSPTEDAAPDADNDQKKSSEGKEKSPKSNPEAADGKATYPPKLRKGFRKKNEKS